MRNPGGRPRWRSRRYKIHGAGRHCPGPGTAYGQTAHGGTAADEIMTGEIVASEPVASEPAASRVAAGETVAVAMQLAIGLLTASLDSPELEARALAILMPHDADGLGDFMAGLHVVSELLIHELHEATGEPPEAILQRLAIMAEHRRGTPSAG
jgi:hypothetical protein